MVSKGPFCEGAVVVVPAQQAGLAAPPIPQHDNLEPRPWAETL